MLKKLRRKVYRKIRFQTWYRKAYYYHRKRRDLDKTIAQYRGVDVLSDKKRLYRLRRDMIRSLFRYGSYYNEYFLFGYEGKDAAYRDGFITEGIRMSYYPRMNDPKNTNMLENKYLTYQKFRDFYGRDVLRIKKGAQPTPAALEALRDFTQAHPRYIVKPVYAAFGKGVHTESIADYPYPEAAHAAYSAHGAILEEIIEQGEELARIHPQSVNTLRIPTVVLADGSVRLFHPTLRVGRGDGIIDNFSAGGISALIDPETGCICSDGADKKGRRYAAHPDTGVRFNGYRLPEWDKAVAMVTTAAHMVPGNHYCGWDLAYSTHGWCMVEANCTAQMGGMQIITQTGRKAELEALIAQMCRPACHHRNIFTQTLKGEKTMTELEKLVEKDAIRDQYYVYARALDRIDNPLGKTVFAEDAQVDYGPTYKGTGYGFIDMMLKMHRKMVSTHHVMTNILIKLNEDGTKAAAEAYMYAACKYRNGMVVVARCRDIDLWEKRDGKWLVVKRTVAGDNTMILHPDFAPDYNNGRDKVKDPSYDYFETIE